MPVKLLLIFCLTGLHTFAQSNYFKLIGELPEDINTEVRLIINNDTLVTQASDKRFVFEGSLENAVQVTLSSNLGRCGSKFYLEPGTVTLKTSVSKSGKGVCIFEEEVVGSTSEDKYKAFVSRHDEILKSKASNASKNCQLKALIGNTINANPDFIFSAQLLQQYAKQYGADWTNAQYETLSERIKATKNGQRVKNLLTQMQAVKPGSLFPEIALPNGRGQPFFIPSLKGKIVLVDFWASWCLPCRRQIPALKKLYAVYKSQGFEVVAVSLDKDYTKWKEAIKSENLTWVNLSDLKAFSGEMATHFGLQEIPFNILVDRNGKIVGSDLKGDEVKQAIKTMMML